MKKSVFVLSAICVLLIVALAISSCSKSKTKNGKTIIDKETPAETPKGSNGEGAKYPEGAELAKTLTPEILKEAHELIPAYPGAELDTAKGNYSKTALGKNYNIVYHTSDSIDKVADFFRKSIAEEYRKEVSSSSDSPQKWINFNFGSPNFSQSGQITLYEINDKTTEIIYYILQPSSNAAKK